MPPKKAAEKIPDFHPKSLLFKNMLINFCYSFSMGGGGEGGEQRGKEVDLTSHFCCLLFKR